MQRVMFKTIVCATATLGGLTDCVRHAVHLARLYGAELRIVHVRGHHPQHVTSGVFGAHGADAARIVLKTTIAHGEPAREVAAVATRSDASLVVIGHGMPTLPTAMTIAAQVLRDVGCPVLVVPERAGEGHATSAGYQEIVCAVSSGLSTSTLMCALSLAQECEARLTLVNVDTPAAWGQWHPGREVLENDLERLRTHIPPSAHAWCEIDELICQGDPANEVAAIGERVAADLIVVGTGSFAEWRGHIGSLPADVLARSACPVMLVPFMWQLRPARGFGAGQELHR